MSEELKNNDTGSWDLDEIRRAIEESAAKQEAEDREEAARAAAEHGEAPREAQKSRAEASSEPAPRQRSPYYYNPKRRNPFLGFIMYVVCVVLLSALLAAVGWLLMSDLCAFNKAPLTASIEVTAEDDVASVAKKLENAGLIKYPWFFRLFGTFAKAEENIGIGTYTLTTEMDYRALIVGMRSSVGNMNLDTVRVMIPEGYTVMQTIQLLAENGVNTEEAFLEAAATYKFKYDFIDNESTDIERLEGYLFPDTYDFYVGEKASDALNRLLKNCANKLDALEVSLAEAEKKGYDLQEILTIASLIEKETDGTDQAKIASVIYNRLENPTASTAGYLQIDAALLYGLEGHTGAITNEDKEADTPYNLYKNKGLPPTAIANPGFAAIQAALNPEDTGYFYYALGKDHRHHFFSNYNDHVNFINSSSYIGN